MSGWVDRRTSTLSSEDNDNRTSSPEGSPTPANDACSNENGSYRSSKFPLRKIGDMFRSTLRSSGNYSSKAYDESVVQECKISEDSIEDAENSKTAEGQPTEQRRPSVPTAEVVAVLINEKPVRMEGGLPCGTTGSRTKRTATLNRTFKRRKSVNASLKRSISTLPLNGGLDHNVSNGPKRQSISSQGTSGDVESEVVLGKGLGRERVNSTSHYSTEKSGSSGYYSTNIYFAGSSVVDDHIYYEPVVTAAAATATSGGDRKNLTNTVKRAPGAIGGRSDGPLKNSRAIGDSKNSLSKSSSRSLNKYYYPAPSGDEPSDKATKMRTKPPGNEKLTDIMEGPDGQIPRPIWPLDTDDSLADINLEAFSMRDTGQRNLMGFESPTSNSDNEIYSGNKKDQEESERKKSQYEEYLEFHNTRNILEQIRGKLDALLEQRNDMQKTNNDSLKPTPAEVELEEEIAKLKSDLECYLQSMNQKNENEIKRFYRGISMDAKVLAVQHAVEQRQRSRSSSINVENVYEVLGNSKSSTQPYYSAISPRSVKSFSGEERKTEDHPTYFEAVYVHDGGFNVRHLDRPMPNPFAQEVRTAQMLQNQRALNCQQRYLGSEEMAYCGNLRGCERRPSQVSIEMPENGRDYIRVVDGGDIVHGAGMIPSEGGAIIVDGGTKRRADVRNSNNLGKSGDISGFTLQRVILMESLGKNGKMFGDKEKMLLEYHLNKPSYWEMYYGANREEQKPHQTLIRKMKIGGKNAISVSYPSTRPESDFTLDMPRAEQLRVKMKKEKQFRSRCRWFFYFLSVVFFLLSVMVVSLVLTRGKRMFGSMI
ncbi:uncharacterized protein LOC129768538 [Toxorhynchites rutilus septentrionalis]|uniref:uncharacterized protein LOC129768538 n=1 Tax=Toxorhynchites rutilus septentrionalis TaxID=329112 RepID=UPI0024789018|nr:uncharacterized protein LOC129768538 [Toxorhynchites rutilus septentrionalis]XP_055626235.1 uncharacterized protein LOC129768538 [Toxorhynchites rutilus septentrionalis]